MKERRNGARAWSGSAAPEDSTNIDPVAFVRILRVVSCLAAEAGYHGDPLASSYPSCGTCGEELAIVALELRVAPYARQPAERDLARRLIRAAVLSAPPAVASASGAD